MDISIRNMTIEDLRGTFLALRGEGINLLPGDGRPEEILADLYMECPELCFTAYLKKKDLGYIGGRLIESGGRRAARIVLFTVAEGPRGDRAAAALFERFRNACCDLGVLEIYSPAIPADHPGMEVYRRLGFTHGGTWSHFRHDTGHSDTLRDSSPE